MVGGQLGKPSGARFRTYERLKHYAERIAKLESTSEVDSNYYQILKAIQDIYRYPLREAAKDALNRQLRSGISDADLAELVINLRNEHRLCLIHEQERRQEPHIICSLGLSSQKI